MVFREHPGIDGPEIFDFDQDGLIDLYVTDMTRHDAQSSRRRDRSPTQIIEKQKSDPGARPIGPSPGLLKNSTTSFSETLSKQRTGVMASPRMNCGETTAGDLWLISTPTVLGRLRYREWGIRSATHHLGPAETWRFR